MQSLISDTQSAGRLNMLIILQIKKMMRRADCLRIRLQI